MGYHDAYSPEDDAAIEAGAAEGLTAADLEREIKRPAGGIYKRANALGIPLKRGYSKPRRSRPYTREDDIRIRQLASSGVTARDAAKELGRTFFSLQKHARVIGVKFLKPVSTAKGADTRHGPAEEGSPVFERAALVDANKLALLALKRERPARTFYAWDVDQYEKARCREL